MGQWVKGQSGNPSGVAKTDDPKLVEGIARDLNTLELEGHVLSEAREKAAIRLAWEIGRLEYKRSALQRDARGFWQRTKAFSRQCLFHLGRQIGKTFLLNSIAIDYCIQNPRCTVVYIAPVEKKLAAWVRGILNSILFDCPADILPKRLDQKNQLVFSNGSVIHYFGATHDNHNAIRGLGSVSFIVLDEAGFFSNLPELIAVVSPMLLRANGFLVFSSSSPEAVDHPFVALIEQAKM